MVLNVTLIKSTWIMKDIIDSEYWDKHAITKVILCKDQNLLLRTKNQDFTNFLQKNKGHKQSPVITRIKIQICNKEYNLNEGRTQHKSKESTILHENQWEGTTKSV